MALSCFGEYMLRPKHRWIYARSASARSLERSMDRRASAARTSPACPAWAARPMARSSVRTSSVGAILVIKAIHRRLSKCSRSSALVRTFPSKPRYFRKPARNACSSSSPLTSPQHSARYRPLSQGVTSRSGFPSTFFHRAACMEYTS